MFGMFFGHVLLHMLITSVNFDISYVTIHMSVSAHPQFGHLVNLGHTQIRIFITLFSDQHCINVGKCLQQFITHVLFFSNNILHDNLIQP